MNEQVLQGRRGVVVSESPEVAARISSYLRRHLWRCDSTDVVTMAKATEYLRANEHGLIICILPRDSSQVESVLHQLRSASPRTLIAVGEAQDPGLILHALNESAADHYVDINDFERQLGVLLERLQPAHAGNIIATVSPGGGAGASTLASNLALLFGQPSDPCMLIDMNRQFGIQSCLLDLKPTSTLADFCSNLARVDAEMFEQLVVQHKSGVVLLAAPSELADAASVTREGWSYALDLASQLYSTCIVDADPCALTEQAALFERADAVIVVFEPFVPGLQNLRRSLTFFEQANIDMRRVWVVVNETGLPYQLRVSQIRESLKARKISHFEVLPYDPRRVNRAHNIGVPVVIGAPRCRFSKKVKALAAKLRQVLSESDRTLTDRMAIAAQGNAR